MEDFKNQSHVIIAMERPLFELDDRSIAAFIVNAEFLAMRAKESEDQESFSTKLLWATAFNMIERAELEKAWRN